MSNYIVSARKYRPARFDEVVGQQHITKTLKNAIKNEKIAQAFLFCGPRGVGKTTCARILAKTINCENLGSEVEACGECKSCQSFQSHSSFNVHELDAASNNSVEDMRSLTDQVRYPPQTGHYKIYIIDEVHMLSQSAFNAFLKTLEEPPPYAIFILATTEKHKILPTILSRCQIFDFNRIEVKEIVSHLEEICQQESLEYEDDALHMIAQKADGALRDALSIFDRLVSFADGKLTYEQVLENLNILDYDYYFKIVDALLSEDRVTVLNIYNDILQQGFEGETFINGLSQHLRDLMMCKDPKTVELLEVSDNLKDRYREQAQYSPAGFLLSALDLANKCGIQYKYAKNKRLTIELALMKMCYLSRAVENPHVAMEAEASSKKKPQSEPQSVEQAPAAPSSEAAEPEEKQDPQPSQSTDAREEEPPAEVASSEMEPAPEHQPEEVEPEGNDSPTNESSVAEPDPNEQPPSKPKKTKKKKRFGGQATSHDDLLHQIDEVEQKEKEAAENGSGDAEAQQKPSVSKEAFAEAWNKMVTQIKERDETTLLTILESYEPEFISGYQVKITVSNAVELQLMKDEKLKITDILGNLLNQTNLELLIDHDPDIQAREADQEGQKHYTVKEKLERLQQANPSFEKLRKKLGLEPDF